MNTIPFHRSPLWFFGFLLLVGTGCAGSDEARTQASSSPQRTVRVETIKLKPTTFEDAIEVTGSIESLNDAQLSAQASGTVEYLAALGERVDRGAPVARLDQDLARAAVEQAQANFSTAESQFALAEDTYKRQKPLYQDSIISALEYQNVMAQYNQAQAQLDQAKATLSQAEKQLDNTVIRAPFAGTVEEHFVEEGEQVVPSTPVARVVSTRHVRVRVGIPERYASDIEVGTSAEVRLKTYGMQPRSAPVTFVGQAINPQSRTFPIEIELDNPDGRLKPEMIARVLIPRSTLDDVLVVPRTAVIRSEEGDAVFVVERTDTTATAARRTVTLGPAYGGEVVIDDGLQAGEEVVVLGQTDLTEGVALNVVQQYASVAEAARSFDDQRPGRTSTE